MDKLVVLVCYDFETYERLHKEPGLGAVEDMEQAFIQPLRDNGIFYHCMNCIEEFAHCLKTYCEIEMMAQDMKAHSFREAMYACNEFTWRYFYPVERIYDAVQNGRQVIFLHTFDAPEFRRDIELHVRHKLNEHNHINQSNSLLVPVYVGKTYNMTANENNPYFRSIPAGDDLKATFGFARDAMYSILDEYVVINDRNNPSVISIK